VDRGPIGIGLWTDFFGDAGMNTAHIATIISCWRRKHRKRGYRLKVRMLEWTRGWSLVRMLVMTANVELRMLRDDRLREDELRTIFDVEDAPNKLG